MRKLLIVLVALATLWVVAEIAVIPAMAESEVEKQVSRRTQDVAEVEADIDSFPLATGVLLTGRIREATITLGRAVRQNVTYATVRFEMSGIQLDRATLFNDPRITAIDHGTVVAEIDLNSLSPLLGRISERIGADVEISGGSFSVGGFSAQFAQDFLPCEPDGRVEGGRVILSCTIDDVPEILLERAQE
jgi:hypothetical protein